MSSGADKFVSRASQIILDAAQGKIAVLPDDFDAAIEALMENNPKQTVRTFEKIVQAFGTRTEGLPTMLFVMTADEPVDDVRDVELTINSYTRLDNLSAEARFRVRAEMGIPLHCDVEWVSEEDGGRKNGPPKSGYSAPARVAGTEATGPWASVILTWVDEDEAPPGAQRHGVSLLNSKDPKGWDLLKPGAVLDVHEGLRVVAKVRIAAK